MAVPAIAQNGSLDRSHSRFRFASSTAGFVVVRSHVGTLLLRYNLFLLHLSLLLGVRISACKLPNSLGELTMGNLGSFSTPVQSCRLSERERNGTAEGRQRCASATSLTECLWSGSVGQVVPRRSGEYDSARFWPFSRAHKTSHLKVKVQSTR